MIGLIVFLLTACLPAGLLPAQGSSPRLSDKDVRNLMKNLSQDSKTFANNFKKAVERSTIRKTSREKEAKQLADRFVQQTEGLGRQFERTKKADAELPVIYKSVKQLDALMQELSIQGVAASNFTKVKTELDEIAKQFSFTPSS